MFAAKAALHCGPGVALAFLGQECEDRIRRMTWALPSLFLLRQGEIVALNEDHSLAPEIDKLAAAGRMTWEDAKADPRRHFLRSALNGADMDLIDRSHRPLALEPGDVVILASDGIHTLSEPDILRVATENAARGPEAIADALLAAVDAAGDIYQDNTTVVVVEAKPD